MKKLIVLACLFVAVLLSGWRQGVTVFQPSLRSVFNIEAVDGVFNYAFIDHVRIGSAGVVPFAGASYAAPTYYFTTGANKVWNSSILNSAGYPIDATANGVTWGNHIIIPSSADYSTYELQWTGDCRLQLPSGTWTVTQVVSNPQSNYVQNGNGDWSGTAIKLKVTYAGPKNQITWQVIATNQFGHGFCTDFHFYRQADETDFNNGLVFRRDWKSLIVAQDPSAVRFVLWHGGNNPHVYRWENRARVASATWSTYSALVSPPYGETTNVANDYSLAAVAGTPASMQHGEIATARLNASELNAHAGGWAVSAIQKCNGGACTCSAGNGQVTTSSPTGFSTGDKVIFQVPPSAGMQEIFLYQTTVTVCDSTHFNTTINTTGFSTFTSGVVSGYLTLQVGSGNDRVAYPIIDAQAANPITIAGNSGFEINYFHAGDYRTFYFDKTVFASRDGSGNPVAGAWITDANSGSTTNLWEPTKVDTPIEVCTTLVNELNAMGPAHPISMWVNMPATALLSMDPDYSAGSNYATNAVNTIINGANGYAGLTTSAQLFVEYSNETWNGQGYNTATSFPQTQYLEQRALLRLGTTAQSIAYMTALRATVMANNVNNSTTNPRVHFILAGQGGNGIDTAGNTQNGQRAFGNSKFFNDVAITALPTISKTGTTHGSTTIDGIASTTGLIGGSQVACSDCQANTQITAVGVNSITVNLATTGSHSNISLTITPSPIFYFWGWAWGSYFDPNPVYLGQASSTISSASPALVTATNNFVADQAVWFDGTVPTGVTASPTSCVNTSTCTLYFVCGSGLTTSSFNISTTTGCGNIVNTSGGQQFPTIHSWGTHTLTDDSAMYNGTDNRGSAPANGGGCYTNAGGACTGANQSQAITNFIAQVTTSDTGSCTNPRSNTTASFIFLSACYSAAFTPWGKYSVGYEGGQDWNVASGTSIGGGHTITSADQTFLLAVQGSAGWSAAQQAFFTAHRANSFSIMPPIFNGWEQRWGYTTVNNTSNTPDAYSGGVEGAALNTTWTTNGTANQSLNFLLKRDLVPASNDNDPMWLEKAA